MIITLSYNPKYLFCFETMIPMRIVFLAMVSSMMLSNFVTGETNDRVDVIISQIVQMGQRIDKLIETEEIAVSKVVKLEHYVGKMDKNLGEMKQQIGEVTADVATMDKNLGQVKNEVGEMKSQVDGMEKMVKVDHDLFTSGAVIPGWKYVGRGFQASFTKVEAKYHISLSQCVTFCEGKRNAGGNWNGLWYVAKIGACQCNLDDSGHKDNADYMHFRCE